MNRRCREFLPSLKRPSRVAELLRRSTIVTDPETLTYLRTQVEKRSKTDAKPHSGASETKLRP